MDFFNFFVKIVCSHKKYEMILPDKKIITILPGEIIKNIANIRKSLFIWNNLSFPGYKEAIENPKIIYEELYKLLSPYLSEQTVYFVIADYFNEIKKTSDRYKICPEVHFNYSKRLITMLSAAADNTLFGNYEIPVLTFALDERIDFKFSFNSIDRIIERIYTIKSLPVILVLDFERKETDGILIKNCANCDKWFIVQTRSDVMYCDNPAPQDPTKSCKKYAGRASFIKKRQDNEALNLYNLLLSAQIKKVKRNPDIPEYAIKLKKLKSESKIWKNQIKRGEKTEIEYIEWLKLMKNS